MDGLLNIYKAIAENFALDGEIVDISLIGNGHINVSLKVQTTKRVYLMQNVNTYVFPNVKVLMNNISLVTGHLLKKGKETLRIVPTKSGESYFSLYNLCYRVYDFIEGGITLDSLPSKNMFESVGRAFGEFQKDLSDFDSSMLIDTIPNFHNTPKRYKDFEFSVLRDKEKRSFNAREEINFVIMKKDTLSKITNGLMVGEIPYRVTHNDTKLNNVVLDERTKEVRAVIDLDTVMKGSLLYDFGDSIRFGASTASEDEKDLKKVHFDIELFEYFAQGFLPILKDELTPMERDLIPYSAYLMCMECGMRFLTDYLDGDSYFKTEYPEHNLVRARTQFKLAMEIEEKLSEMKKTVDKILDE